MLIIREFPLCMPDHTVLSVLLRARVKLAFRRHPEPPKTRPEGPPKTVSTVCSNIHLSPKHPFNLSLVAILAIYSSSIGFDCGVYIK